MKTVKNFLPKQWRVTLKSGQTLGVLADMYGEVNGLYVFDLYVEATPEEQADDRLVITSKNPTDPAPVSVAVAAIPVDEVREIWSGDWDLPVPRA